MAFNKDELKQLEKIVGGIEERLGKKIDLTNKEILGIKGRIISIETKIVSLENDIKSLKVDMVLVKGEIGFLKDEITSLRKEMRREIVDLTEINRAVIDRVSRIDEFEQRLVRLEAIVLKGGYK